MRKYSPTKNNLLNGSYKLKRTVQSTSDQEVILYIYFLKLEIILMLKNCILIL